MNSSDNAFCRVAAASITDQEKRRSVIRQFSSFNLASTADNEAIVNVAKSFLTSACPELLTVLESHPDEDSAEDRLIKIGRNINATMRYGSEVVDRHKRGDAPLMNVWSPEEAKLLGNEAARSKKTDESLKRLVKECSDLAKLLKGSDNYMMKVPKVKYGRTQMMMPIVSLGCMRFQQSWNRGGNSVTSPQQVEEDCQENLVKILRHAIHCGVNHIETAKGYGCSELQLGMALKVLFEEGVKREDLIIQTKGGVTANMTKSDYKSSIVNQLKTLGVDYVDLFSIHGLNTEDHYNWVFDNGEKGNLIDAVRELRKEGKIRWIGFSTHGPAHVIKKAIESDAFDSINLHHHFMGSYTASGDGDENFQGNLENVRLAHQHDMGVFIISPFDKGGRLYTPTHLTRELTLPEMEPMEYGAHWLWYHGDHSEGAPVHTIVCGAARPADLDQPVLAAIHFNTLNSKKNFEIATSRIQERRESVFGKDWVKMWHYGLPNYSDSDRGSQIGNIVWLYNVIHVFGMLDYASDRYANMLNNSKKWDFNKSWKDNVMSNPGFNWMPGCSYDCDYGYASELSKVPKENVQRVIEAMKFVHEWCAPGGAGSVVLEAGLDEKKEDDGNLRVIPLEWQSAYDARPWTAFPER